MTNAPDTLLDLIRSRRSVRRFTDQPVDREKILMCLEAARLAPSAENVQPWRYFIADDPEIKAKLVEGAFSGIYHVSRWAAAAPVLVVLFAELDLLANRIGKQITGISYYLIDLGISGEHFALQAHALGLGICWIGWFSASGVRRALLVPRKYRPVAMFAMGYPTQTTFKNKRTLPLEEMAWFNRLPE